MDFSSLNPITSNSLNLAARKNDVKTVQRLLKKINPNCIDNRGWTCLHEAAANDSLQSLLIILNHPDCRPLSETHEGHTALYLACRHLSSKETIRALLENVDDIANYGSTECVTPLHIASAQGKLEVMQLLIDHGAILNVQDFDGDTPLHDAALGTQHEAVALLLHSGADASIRNEPHYNTPFHLACYKGCLQTIKNLFPFISDINQVTVNRDTPLALAVQSNNNEIIEFLLENGADPHIKNLLGDLALNTALHMGHNTIFRTLLHATDKDKIDKDIIMLACKPHYFKFEILEDLLNHDLGPEFYDYFEPFHVTLEEIGDFRPTYLTNNPLNWYLNICDYIYSHSLEKFKQFFYTFLMNGVGVNVIDVNECPPLVYIHYSAHSSCFPEVFSILIELGCNVDHCSAIFCSQKQGCLPDAFMASLTSNPSTSLIMLPYSLRCEPDFLLNFAYKNNMLSRIPMQVQKQLLAMIDSRCEDIKTENLQSYVLSLKHLCRLTIRWSLWDSLPGAKSTEQFLKVLQLLPIPLAMKGYLRYLI